MTFNGTLYPYQAESVEKMVDTGCMLLGLVMGAGKATLSTTPVLTPDGWVPVKDIHVGDYVVGSNGCPTKVLGVYPQGVRPCYRVSFNDGTSTIVDRDHLWYVESPADRYHERPGKVLETWKMADSEHVEPGQERYGKPFRTYFRDDHGNNRWSIPIGDPPMLSAQDLPIDPYTLGALLGDGTFRASSTMLYCHADDADEMANLVVGASKPRSNGSCWSFSIKGLMPALRELGLAGTKAHTKFVPPRYLLGTPLQRLAILQGLMDTDGYTGKKGTVEFVSVSQQLAQDVTDLARSLGAYAYMREKTTTCMYKGEKVYGAAWRVTFKMSSYVPFRLSRKVASYRRQEKYQPLRVITDITPVDPADTTCIAVDAPDHLYVIEHYIVTHNTVTTIAAVETLLARGDIDRCLIVVPVSLKYQWLREIQKFTDSRAIVIDGVPKNRERLWRSSISSQYIIVNPESLAKDTLLFKSLKWECMVIDESTMIKSRVAKRSKLLKRIGKTVPYRFALTGQPIENRPEELFSIMEFVDPDVLGRFDVFDRTFIVRDHWGRPVKYRNLKTLFETLSKHLIRKTREDIADQLPKIIHQTIPVPFDPKGAALYNRISHNLLIDLQKAMSAGGGGGFNLWKHYNDPVANEAQGQIMSKLTALRMLCDSPELLRRSASIYLDTSKPGQGSAYAALLQQEGALDSLVSQPKMEAVVDYIKEVLEEDPNNKVVLFSFFKENLKIIQEQLSKVCGSVLFTGDMNAEEKDQAKVRFSTNADVRLFLSSDAGGYGVDLPMANYLISFDLPWSSGKLEQREARIIRLSSKFDHVTIATFLMQGSIEERQYEMLQQKKLINEAWVDGKHHDIKGSFELTLSSLSSFLRDSTV